MEVLRVLLADDEEPILDGLMNLSWEKNGYCVTGACRNGKEALILAKRDKPDIVITDISMPIMDGINLAKALKEYDRSIEIVILTCHSDFLFAKEAIRIGVRDYLVKGIYRESELFASLNRCRTYSLASRIHAKDGEEMTITRLEIKSVLNYIDQNINRPIHLSDAADHVQLSKNYLGKLFKEEMKDKFSDYVTKRKMIRAAELLLTTNEKIYQVGIACGYNNYRSFTLIFLKHFNKTPTQYRRGI
jgi:two-component system response regulator YesN